MMNYVLLFTEKESAIDKNIFYKLREDLIRQDYPQFFRFLFSEYNILKNVQMLTIIMLLFQLTLSFVFAQSFEVQVCFTFYHALITSLRGYCFGIVRLSSCPEFIAVLFLSN